MELNFQGVNDSLRDMVYMFSDPKWGDNLLDQPGRGGTRVKSVAEPVILNFSSPRNRVVFNEVRDANPFYHLYEALWMLAGRNDADSLGYYEKMVPEFSDNGNTMNGAYGYRWRHSGQYKMLTGVDSVSQTGVDQLDVLVKHLKSHPFSRRAVLQMWNVQDDLLKINEPNISKDVCCNLACKFRVMPIMCPKCNGEKGNEVDTGGQNPDGSWWISTWANCPICDGEGQIPHSLDMTVYNRANDVTWGLLGCNFVTLTILHEYMAARLGLELGNYCVMTTDLHYFYERDNTEGLIGWYETENRTMWSRDRYSYYPSKGFTVVNPTSLYIPNKDPGVTSEEGHTEFIRELNLMVDYGPTAHQRQNSDSMDSFRSLKYKFFSDVCNPMFHAFGLHKQGKSLTAAQQLNLWMQTRMSNMYGQDWLLAGIQWLERRHEKALKKEGKK